MTNPVFYSSTNQEPIAIKSMSVVLRRFRIWMVVLSSVSVDLRGVYYGMAVTNPPFEYKQEQQQQREQGEPYRLLWQDWSLIVINVLIYIVYVYSLRGQTRIKNKYLRAGLMSLLALLLIALSIDLILVLLRQLPNRGAKTFECHVGDPVCYLRWSSIFVDMIKACFVMVEVALTWRMGPLEPTRPSSIDELAQHDDLQPGINLDDFHRKENNKGMEMSKVAGGKFGSERKALYSRP
ncbi:MAG: hypothetical protein J3Q66DRAFT_347773 [Benniella sp.]|nr:MAG: hypothetical protein J3Q66DRAFT_347773 [Benniella sp.]